MKLVKLPFVGAQITFQITVICFFIIISVAYCSSQM